MDVIGHDDVAADDPPVAGIRVLPFFEENLWDWLGGEDRLPKMRARRKEIIGWSSQTRSSLRRCLCTPLL